MILVDKLKLLVCSTLLQICGSRICQYWNVEWKKWRVQLWHSSYGNNFWKESCWLQPPCRRGLYLPTNSLGELSFNYFNIVYTSMPLICIGKSDFQVNLVEWLKTMVTIRNAEGVLDPRLPKKPSPRALKRALLVALRCVDPNAQKRPKMGHVVHMLEADEFPFRDVRAHLSRQLIISFIVLLSQCCLWSYTLIFPFHVSLFLWDWHAHINIVRARTASYG